MNFAIVNKIMIPVLAAFMLFGCSDKEEREALREEAASLEKQLYERDSAFNEVLTVIEQAEKQINEIKERENLVSVHAEGEMTDGGRTKIIDDLSQIDRLIKETNQKVADLSGRLETTNIQVAAFKRKIDKLSNNLREREESIVMLKQTLAQKNLEIKDLNTELTGIKSEFDQQSELVSLQVQIIDQRQEEINRAYYAIGEEQSLIDKGLIAKEGGFLGLGRTRDLMENVPLSKLNEIDKTLVDQFELNGKKVELVTEHPTGSYRLVQQDGVVKYLKIDNPDEFWKISKYLVVSIKS